MGLFLCHPYRDSVKETAGNDLVSGGLVSLDGTVPLSSLQRLCKRNSRQSSSVWRISVVGWDFSSVILRETL